MSFFDGDVPYTGTERHRQWLLAYEAARDQLNQARRAAIGTPEGSEERQRRNALAGEVQRMVSRPAFFVDGPETVRVEDRPLGVYEWDLDVVDHANRSGIGRLRTFILETFTRQWGVPMRGKLRCVLARSPGFGAYMIFTSAYRVNVGFDFVQRWSAEHVPGVDPADVVLNEHAPHIRTRYWTYFTHLLGMSMGPSPILEYWRPWVRDNHINLTASVAVAGPNGCTFRDFTAMRDTFYARYNRERRMTLAAILYRTDVIPGVPGLPAMTDVPRLLINEHAATRLSFVGATWPAP